jgi:hypothetical protein
MTIGKPMVALGLLLAPGCTRQEVSGSETTSDAAAAVQPTAPNVHEASPQPAQVKPTCIDAESGLIVHAATLNTIRPKGDGEAKTERVLWNFSCKYSTAECNGAFLQLRNIDQRAPIVESDLNAMTGMRVASRRGSVVTLQWGIGHTFTVDFHEKSVRYSKTEDTLEIRGEGACP